MRKPAFGKVFATVCLGGAVLCGIASIVIEALAVM